MDNRSANPTDLCDLCSKKWLKKFQTGPVEILFNFECVSNYTGSRNLEVPVVLLIYRLQIFFLQLRRNCFKFPPV